MTTHRLTVEDGTLYFPYGAQWGTLNADGNVPSLLMRVYDAGDCDTCPWPMVSAFRTESELRIGLACALYDERETNGRFAYGDSIELPDGTTFDFDPLVP